MQFDFDKVISRERTDSVKYDARQEYFGTRDVRPMWVADMDFAVPMCITEALQARIQHPIFGYSLYPESLYQTIIDWFHTRHNWRIERDWILMAPGVVPSLFAAVHAFTQENEDVIVQPPVYFPFFSAVTTNKRKLVLNPLEEKEGKYLINFEHLEDCARNGARLLFLCSPHNPVGLVWREAELQQLLTLARRYDMTIISDDIHCDLVYPGTTHTMLGRLAQEGDNIITTIAPNKTFNIPGLGLSALVIPNSDQRKAMKAAFELLHSGNGNPLSIVAFEAAYRQGHSWLDQLMQYLTGTRDAAVDFIEQELPHITCIKPEATYLLWLDCRKLALSDVQLRDFFIKKCKLGMNPGSVFGQGGSGFMRLNIGAPQNNVLAALESIKQQL